MAVRITFETHSTTTDNEAGLATVWLPGELSSAGRDQAIRLGDRRRNDAVDAVFTSDLARAIETATLAFQPTPIPVLHDWQLGECDYGELNGAPRSLVIDPLVEYLSTPHPGGESWTQAIERVGGVLHDLTTRWDGRHIVVIGHVATRWGLDHFINGRPLEDLVIEQFSWQDGWEYPFSVQWRAPVPGVGGTPPTLACSWQSGPRSMMAGGAPGEGGSA
jgi:broad specificity phosphatase PhoE